MLTFKTGVFVHYFDERIALVLREATLWSLRTSVAVHVSSVDDGDPKRLVTSLHGKSLAVDVNVTSGNTTDRADLGNWLRVRLPTGYDVVLEADHVHVEADAHRAALAQVAS